MEAKQSWLRLKTHPPKLFGNLTTFSTVLRFSLVNKYNFAEISTAAYKNLRGLLLLYQRRARRASRPCRSLRAYGLIYGQSYQVRKLTVIITLFDWTWPKDILRKREDCIQSLSPTTSYTYYVLQSRTKRCFSLIIKVRRNLAKAYLILSSTCFFLFAHLILPVRVLRKHLCSHWKRVGNVFLSDFGINFYK